MAGVYIFFFGHPKCGVHLVSTGVVEPWLWVLGIALVYCVTLIPDWLLLFLMACPYMNLETSHLGLE